MAGRKSKPGEVVVGSASMPKVFKVSKHEASGSMQPHMLYSRKEIRKLIMEKLSGGVHPTQRSEKEPFEYTVVDGALYVKLKTPILRGEVKEIIDPISTAIKKIRTEYREKAGITRKGLKRGEYPEEVSMPSELQVLWEGGKSPSESREAAEAATEATEEDNLDDTGKKYVLFTKFPLLALTSKMGCMSFNLPAGPATHEFYGTCSAAAYGFPMIKDELRPKKSSQWYELPKTAKGEVDHAKVKSQFLCSGCYGLKGLYGSPMIFTMMECRKQWVETMMQKRYQADFVKMMVRAIRMAQAQSITEKYFLTEMGMQKELWSVPDPAYFRIHDVGDIFHQNYLENWFAVIRECSKSLKIKLGFTLPAIRFWMPSRIWIAPGKVSDHFKCMGIDPGCVPENLTIRPSAIHFGDACPDIPSAKGLSMGAGATGIGQALTDKDIQEAEKVVGKLYGQGGNGWICPAYLAPETLGGGGAEWTPMGGKRKGLQLVGGACARAFGPDGEPPPPKGKGCRACWDRPELKIVYPEH